MRFATRVTMLLSVVSLLALSPTAFGQAVYGSIYGTVTDATGATVPGATVTVTDVAKGTTVTVQSNGTGDFTVEHLIPDVYDVKVEMSGFNGYEQKGIHVSADSSVKVVAALAVGGSTVIVEVNADAGSAVEDGPRGRRNELQFAGVGEPSDSRPQLYRSSIAASGRGATRMVARCG